MPSYDYLLSYAFSLTAFLSQITTDFGGQSMQDDACLLCNSFPFPRRQRGRPRPRLRLRARSPPRSRPPLVVSNSFSCALLPIAAAYSGSLICLPSLKSLSIIIINDEGLFERSR